MGSDGLSFSHEWAVASSNSNETYSSFSITVGSERMMVLDIYSSWLSSVNVAAPSPLRTKMPIMSMGKIFSYYSSNY